MPKRQRSKSVHQLLSTKQPAGARQCTESCARCSSCNNTVHTAIYAQLQPANGSSCTANLTQAPQCMLTLCSPGPLALVVARRQQAFGSGTWLKVVQTSPAHGLLVQHLLMAILEHLHVLTVCGCRQSCCVPGCLGGYWGSCPRARGNAPAPCDRSQDSV